MTARVTNDGPQNRERILQAATRLFAEHGYEGTSLRMIAEATGLQKGSLVYHFASKANIREAVLDSFFSRWKDVLPGILMAAAGGENRFQRVMSECTGFFLEDPARARLLMREVLDNPVDVQVRLSAQLAPWMELLAKAISQGKREGEIRADVDPSSFLWLVTMMALASVASAELVTGLAGLSSGQAEALARLEKELIRMAHSSLFAAGGPKKASNRKE